MIDKQKVIDLLKQFQCSMWADRETMQESRDYAAALLKSSSLDERDFATFTALTVHQNTMVNVLLLKIEELDDGS